METFLTIAEYAKSLGKFIGTIILIFLFLSRPCNPEIPETVRGLYFPAQSFTERKISEFLHYAPLARLNAAVLHLKDTRGWLHWKSDHPIAVNMGAVHGNRLVERSVKRLKANNIWTIAKVDIFADNLFAENHQNMSVLDSKTGRLWADKNGLHWSNPYETRAWDYNIALCKELVKIGFDEIQFDYVRFPSDGDLKSIYYPIVIREITKAECIGRFLKAAFTALHPTGVWLSVDVFGLAAWKKTDFGVGQVVEKIVPYVDVICPMFYPSHFPKGFLRLKNPGKYPGYIMKLSLERMEKRTNINIRPWIQGFWYTPDEIIAQLDEAMKIQTGGWMIWNASGDYRKSYHALEKQMNVKFPPPKFYDSLSDLKKKKDSTIKGNQTIINFTSYQGGYSILSLELSHSGQKRNYSTFFNVLATLDEAIIDQILSTRNLHYNKLTGKSAKIMYLSGLLAKDLGIDLRRMQPKPVYIDWLNKCRFVLYQHPW